MTTTLSDLTSAFGLVTPVLAVIGLIATSARASAKNDARFTDHDKDIAELKRRQDATEVKTASIQSTVADIDKRTCLMDQKIDSNTKLNELNFVNISHDLKNVVMAIRGITKSPVDDRLGD